MRTLSQIKYAICSIFERAVYIFCLRAFTFLLYWCTALYVVDVCIPCCLL